MNSKTAWFMQPMIARWWFKAWMAISYREEWTTACLFFERRTENKGVWEINDDTDANGIIVSLNRYHRIVLSSCLFSYHEGIVLKSSRPSLPLKKAPPFSPSLSSLRDERM